jgi:hypothetical protein
VNASKLFHTWVKYHSMKYPNPSSPDAQGACSTLEYDHHFNLIDTPDHCDPCFGADKSVAEPYATYTY